MPPGSTSIFTSNVPFGAAGGVPVNCAVAQSFALSLGILILIFPFRTQEASVLFAPVTLPDKKSKQTVVFEPTRILHLAVMSNFFEEKLNLVMLVTETRLFS